MGIENRSREFFISHNTETSIKLFGLRDDELVLVADGTYCRIEKSADNEFQYNTYSGQKKDSLIKPFVIVCADGYYVDVWGPYPANNNDATIFRHILDTDPDLRFDILRNGLTHLFLDRGKIIYLNDSK